MFGLGDLFELGKIGVGMSSAFSAISEAGRIRNYYEEQARINENRAQFNTRVARESGLQEVNMILSKTKEVYSYQMGQAGKTGLEYGPTSGMGMLMKDNLTRGLAAAERAMMKSEIAAMNEEYNAMSAIHRSRQQARAAEFQESAATNTLFENIFKLGSTVESGMSVHKAGARSFMDMLEAGG